MLWLWLIVGIILFTGVVVVLLRWANQPIAYRGLLLADSERFLHDFLLQFSTGSVCFFDRESNRESSPGFFQLAIGARHGEQLEVEFGVPDAEWSRDKFDLVHAAIDSAGHRNHVQTNLGNNDIPRFLRVYLQGNRRELPFLLREVLELAAKQLEFRMEDRYTFRMSGTVSYEYQRELATQLEQLPRNHRIAGILAAWLRRSARTRSRP